MVEGAFKTIAPGADPRRLVAGPCRLGADPRRLAADLERVRARTKQLVAHLDADALERAHSPIMSPLAWDLAHIAAYEDLWLAHRHAGDPLLRADLAAIYDAFETPREIRGEIELLDSASAFAYMDDVRERVLTLIERDGVGDGDIHEMVLRHELQHTETMLQTMALADLMPPDWPAGPRLHPGELEGPQWIEIEAGSFEMGASPSSEKGPGSFAYDNERKRHAVQLRRFAIARLPVSNMQWRQFCERGGYEREQWWSREGWAWLKGAKQTRDPRAGVGADDDPVCHVSFHEAQAFARSAKARLPSEAEWERAASAAERPLAAIGEVWEWTSSEFGPYPGFAAHPYREYSEVFFHSGYCVLRGGSFATHRRVATSTFRNWDLPQRRQIFAGLRLAIDL